MLSSVYSYRCFCIRWEKIWPESHETSKIERGHKQKGLNAQQAKWPKLSHFRPRKRNWGVVIWISREVGGWGEWEVTRGWVSTHVLTPIQMRKGFPVLKGVRGVNSCLYPLPLFGTTWFVDGPCFQSIYSLIFVAISTISRPAKDAFDTLRSKSIISDHTRRYISISF